MISLMPYWIISIPTTVRSNDDVMPVHYIKTILEWEERIGEEQSQIRSVRRRGF